MWRLILLALAFPSLGCLDVIGGRGYATVEPNTNPCGDIEVPVSGGCERVGVVACGEGFDPDGRGGCKARLPTTCFDATLAWPGELQCSPVTDLACPIEEDPSQLSGVFSGDLYVWRDTPNAGAGTRAAPFASIGTALAAASPGDTILITRSHYDEDVRIDTANVTLRGVCPEEVAITGGVTITAQGASLEALSVSGNGVTVDGASDVSLSELWIHDTTGRGITIVDGQVQNNVRLDRSVIERARGTAIHVAGARLTMSRTHIRDTAEDVGRLELGRGVVAMPSRYSDEDGVRRAQLVIDRSWLQRQRHAAISVHGSRATVTDTHVNNTLVPESATALGLAPVGHALEVTMELGRSLPLEAAVTIERSELDRSSGAAVRVYKASLRMVATTVRDTLSGGAPSCTGHGVRAIGDRTLASEVSIINSLIDGSTQAGVHLLGANAVIDHTRIHDTAPDVCGKRFGDGVAAHAQPLLSARGDSALTIIRSRIDGSARAAVIAFGGTLALQNALLDEQALVATSYDDGEGELAEIAAVTGSANCERSGVLHDCKPDDGRFEPALYAREPDGSASPMAVGDGSVSAFFQNDVFVENAAVFAVGRDEIPSALSDARGRWYNPFLPADSLIVLAVTEREHMAHVSSLHAGESAIASQLATQRFIRVDAAQLLGTPFDHQNAVVLLDTDTPNLELLTEPAAEKRYYVYNKLPEDGADVTSFSGEALFLHIPSGLVETSVTDDAGGATSCAPGGFGDGRMLAFAGVWNTLRFACE